MKKGRASVGAVVFLILSLISCSPKAFPTPSPAPPSPQRSGSPSESNAGTPTPSADPTSLDQLTYACGEGLPFSTHLFDRPAAAEGEDNPSAAALRAFLSEGQSDVLLPSSGWWLAGRTEIRASYVARGIGGEPFAAVEVVPVNGVWDVQSFSGCHPALSVSGIGPAVIAFVPPGIRPTPDSTTIDFSLTELACASGQPIADRLVGPLLVEAADRVIVAYGVHSLGPQEDCQGSPSSRAQIRLSSPLSDRQLLDAGAFPYRVIGED
jgi:hypothetical protein